MILISPAMVGYVAEVEVSGYVQEFECWDMCPWKAGLKAIRRAMYHDKKCCRLNGCPLTHEMYPCSGRVYSVVDGKHYCRRHDPAMKAAKKAKYIRLASEKN